MNNWLDRLARWSSITITLAVIFGVVSGAAIVVIWRPEVSWETYNVPFIITGLGYMLAVLLGLPNFLAGLWSFARARWKQGAKRITFFIGPGLILFGMEGVSHYLVPCGLVNALGWGTPDWGLLLGEGMQFACEPQVLTALTDNIYSRAHLLHHTLTAGGPFLLLYWFMVKRFDRSPAPRLASDPA